MLSNRAFSGHSVGTISKKGTREKTQTRWMPYRKIQSAPQWRILNIPETWSISAQATIRTVMKEL